PSGGPPPELPDSSRAKPPDRAELEELLARHHGVVADVARAVGRSRKQVYRWIQQCDLDPEAFRGPE
ncbi:MAG: Fis family transcriptional regulator, partial [Sandaracinaceae bacterium]|nr:Fis family transcriptional regulator [Sandaracinaceae bacterium]